MLVTSDVKEYFNEALLSVLAKRSLFVSDDAKAYIVNLLDHFMHSKNALVVENHIKESSMVEMLIKAQQSSPKKAADLFKGLGDFSLYLSGFFQDVVKKKAVNISYYISIGKSSYFSVAELLKPMVINHSKLYTELSNNFEELVKVLSDISLYGQEQTATQDISDEYLLSLINRYQETKSEQIAEILSRHGVNIKSSKDIN